MIFCFLIYSVTVEFDGKYRLNFMGLYLSVPCDPWPAKPKPRKRSSACGIRKQHNQLNIMIMTASPCVNLRSMQSRRTSSGHRTARGPAGRKEKKIIQKK